MRQEATLEKISDTEIGVEDFYCTLCLKLLYKPTTTICGHSFCKSCLSKSLRHRAKCPICRSVLHSSPHRLSVATDLARLLENTFPKEYRSRLLEEESQEVIADVKGSSTHITREDEEILLETMVLCPVLPRQRLHLHIYEPRYRLMTQRCLEGNRRFGMLARNRGGRQPTEYGTEVEIVECEPLPGARYYMEVVGVRVFRVKDIWTTDEYLTCKIEWVELNEPMPTIQTRLLTLSHELEALVEAWQTLVYERGYERNPDQLRRLYRDLGPMPSASFPGDRAMWVAALINPLPALGVAPEIRSAVLSAEDPLERVEIVTEGIKASMMHMKPTLFRSVLSRSLIQLQKIMLFFFRHSWLIMLGWWMAQKFPELNMPISRWLASRLVPPM